MLTPLTQAAIAALNDIYTGGDAFCEYGKILSGQRKAFLLGQLARAGIIHLVNKEKPRNLDSYRLAKKPAEISLLDVLEATGESLNCNHPTSEAFYARYGKAAQKLGIVNHVTRLYLQEINLAEL